MLQEKLTMCRYFNCYIVRPATKCKEIKILDFEKGTRDKDSINLLEEVMGLKEKNMYENNSVRKNKILNTYLQNEYCCDFIYIFPTWFYNFQLLKEKKFIR